NECTPCRRAQVLRIVECCATGCHGETKEKIRERVAGDVVGHEIQKASRHHITIGALPHMTKIEPGLHEVRSPGPCERIENLKHVGFAFLRSRELITERRKTCYGDLTQAPVARAWRKLRKPDLLIQTSALLLLKHTNPNAAVSKSRFVDKACTKRFRPADAQVLP